MTISIHSGISLAPNLALKSQLFFSFSLYLELVECNHMVSFVIQTPLLLFLLY